jgi:hypothetical protein
MLAGVPDPHDRQAWRGVLLSTLLNAVGMPLDLLLATHVPGMPHWPPLASTAIGLLLAALLVAPGRRADPHLLGPVFFINNLAILAALWVTSGHWAATGNWVPFQANKLGVLAVAVLAPEDWVGLVSIAGYVGTALFKSWLLPAAVRARFPVGEPWPIVIYGIFGAALLVYRLKGIRLARRMLQVRLESAAAERLARTFLALRDFTNTPLQTIEFCSRTIRTRDPSFAPILDRIDRSLNRLLRLNQTFSTYEAHLKWTRSDVSLDPKGIIDQELNGAPR